MPVIQLDPEVIRLLNAEQKTVYRKVRSWSIKVGQVIQHGGSSGMVKTMIKKLMSAAYKIGDEIDSADFVQDVCDLLIEQLALQMTQLASAFPSTKRYRMKTNPRGIVLLINIFDYDDEHFPKRDGSKKDMEELKELWERMGFLVQDENRGTKSDIEEAIIKWKNQERMSKVDCGIIMIMAHGSEVSPDSGSVCIHTKDKKTINSEWIVEQMNSVEAFRLHEKPKLLFLLTCRGERPDAGLDLYKLNELINAPRQLDTRPMDDQNGQTQQGCSSKKKKSPRLSDILLIYPSAPGNASSRDPKNGTWFVQTMIDVFNRKAHKDDVETMLKEVDRILVKKAQEGIHDSFQVVCTTNRGFKYKLFLNPPATFSNGNA